MNDHEARLELEVGDLNERIGRLTAELWWTAEQCERERSSRQAWAEEALRLQAAIDQVASTYNGPATRLLTALTASRCKRCSGAADENWFDRSICPESCDTMHTRCSDCGAALDGCALEQERKVCVCVPDDEAAALVDAGWSLPQCTVHPEGGA